MESIPAENGVYIVDACQTRAMGMTVNEYSGMMAPAVDRTRVGMQVISFPSKNSFDTFSKLMYQMKPAGSRVVITARYK